MPEADRYWRIRLFGLSSKYLLAYNVYITPQYPEQVKNLSLGKIGVSLERYTAASQYSYSYCYPM